MKYVHVGALMALWLASGGASAAGIECGEDGGRIVDSHSPVVWVALQDAPIPVTDDPDTQAALAAETGGPVLTPDDLCMQGWVLPAPHPGEPVPAPPVKPMGGRPIPPPPVSLQAHLVGVDFAGADVKAATSAGSDPEASTGDTADLGSAQAVAEKPSSVVIEASDEPTPTPATPAPVREAKDAAGCSATGGGPASGLWALLLVAGLRRRRGGR